MIKYHRIHVNLGNVTTMLSNVLHKRGCLGTWDYMCPARHRPAPVHGSLQQQDRYIPSFLSSLLRSWSLFSEGERDGDDMTWTQIFLAPFGWGPKIGGNRAKAGRQAGRIERMRAQMGYSLQGGSIVDQVISAQEICSLYRTRYTQISALYRIFNIWNLHVNARVFRLILPPWVSHLYVTMF